MKYTVFVLYQTTPAWLARTREQRSAFFSETVAPLLARYENRLSARFFDSEAFHALVSDLLMISCDELQDYYHFMEHLRDTALFTVPYVVLKDVIVSLENGFQKFEKGELRP
ncbi:darcynin family protein [Larkinella soli]|uniref:darcynin family protein n=1 Tax=Larkinella soli TaxID=1770527 RepID=UPI000FFB7360|nr:darcynin family protein [Larkinella soli]